MTDRLRLTILGGYLGAGKTTWARHHLRIGRFGPAPHVIVNEAAGTPVDHLLLGDVSLIAGGCACCAALPRLVAVLRDLCDQRSRGHGPDQVVLETSGLADPAAIARGIAEDPVLVRHLRIEDTIVVVDALHGEAQLQSDALARRQIASADWLVVTKVGAGTNPGPLLALLAQLNPAARVEGANHGEPVSLPPPGALPILTFRDGPPAVLAEICLPQALDWTAFALWLSALLHARGEDVWRVKGIVPSPAGRLLLQAVRRQVQPPEIMPGPSQDSDGVLVFFGPDLPEKTLRQSLARFALAWQPDPSEAVDV